MKPFASGHLFDEHDVVAEALEAPDVVTAGAFRVAAIEVVGSEVMMRYAVLEHMPQGYDHRVLYGDNRFLRTATSFEAVVERAVVALPRANGRPRGLLQRRSRSEEHTSELQSREKLVCRLLLEKKNRRVF